MDNALLVSGARLITPLEIVTAAARIRESGRLIELDGIETEAA